MLRILKYYKASHIQKSITDIIRCVCVCILQSPLFEFLLICLPDSAVCQTPHAEIGLIEIQL